MIKHTFKRNEHLKNMFLVYYDIDRKNSGPNLLTRWVFRSQLVNKVGV